MKTFPIKDEKYGRTFASFYYKHSLPNFEWGEKLYIEYDGKLCAAIPKYAAYVYPVKPTRPSDGTKDLVCFNIAGVGDVLIDYPVYVEGGKVSVSPWAPKVFRTIDEYDRFVKGIGGAFVPDAISMRDILRVHGYTHFREHNCWDLEVTGWFYRGSDADTCPMNFKDVWIDEDGTHVTVIHETGWSGNKKPAYLTKEECMEANRRQVVEFDEEPKHEKKTKRRIVINCDEGFVADTLREIAVRYEDAFEDIGEDAEQGFYEAEHGSGFIEEVEE